jgi:protein ImuA
MRPARSKALESLRRKIEEIEAKGNSPASPAVSLGVGPLDALLPGERLPAGSLVELLSAADGAGAWTLGLLMAKHVCGEWKLLVVIDSERCFYPPGAAQLGIDLERSLVVRPRSGQEALLATNQALRCAAVGSVIGRHDQLRTLDARRLQAAAEAGGGVGFVLRSAKALQVPSFANLRLLIAPLASRDAARRYLRVEIVRCRGGKDGQSVILEIGNEAGDVCVLPHVAPATAPARKARASG